MVQFRRALVLERSAYLLLFATFVASIPFAKAPAVTFPGFREAMFLSSAFAAAATAVVLIALWRAKPRSAYLLLAQGYAVTAVASTVAIFAFPLAPDGATMLRANNIPAPYIYLGWHVVFALVAGVYTGMRWRTRRRADGPVRTTGWIVPFVMPGALSVVFLVVLGLASDRFPMFRPGQGFVGGPVFYIDIVTLAGLIAAAAALGRLPRRNNVDIALGLTLATLALELALNLLSTQRYSFGWSLSRFVMFGSLTFVLVGTGTELIATYRNAFLLRDRLRFEAARSDERSRRMEALWTLARDPARDDERIDRIIAEGVRALSGRAGPVSGRLIEADRLPPGDPILLVANDIEPSVRMLADPYPSVAASFVVERALFVLQFTRTSPADGFDADDLLFVQVLSTLCAQIMEAKARHERVRFQTEREMMTGLYNPTVLRSRLVGAARERGGALLTIRIVNLRDVGRSLGRLATDAIVVEIAALLENEALTDELVARAGDDSFGILFPERSRAKIEARVAAFSARIGRAFDLGDRSGRAAVDVIARLRAVIFDAGSDAEAVLTQASFDDDGGLASERVKIVEYDRDFDRRYAERRDVLAELRAGIERNEIVVHYQPYVDLATGAPVGAEALMRWNHPTRGMLEPAAFMALAHEWGLMPALGESVVARVFADIATLRRRRRDFRVYVNLDAGGFESAGLVERLLQRARDAGVSAAALGVEITETTAMRDPAAAQAVMEALRGANIAIALDDFGTGFSSLAYLKQYPIDVIKIDRSFVAGLPTDPFDVGLVRAIIAVATSFGMRVHAEGIETLDQATWLRESGCATAQGWYYARALPLDEFLAYTAMSGAGMSAGRT